MKFTLSRDALLKSLGHVQSVVERRNTIPILANVLIRVAGSEVSFAATDMEIEINETVEATVGKTGAITAPAHTLYEIVRKLPDGAEVELSAAGSNQLTLSSGRSHFKLGCLPVEDFPKMPEGDLKHNFKLAAGDLRALIDRSRFAISTEETRYYLNGIYLHTAKNKNVDVLRAVATDGHRLARVEMPAPAGAKGIPGVILPRKTVGEVRKLIEESAGEIEISMSEAKVRFTFDGVVITSKLIDGTFPDYERVIPSGNDKILEVDTRVFANAVDRVATISSEKSRAIKISLAPGHVVLSANSPEAGSATEELEAKYDGALLDIGFNARYLLDILQQVEGDGARFDLADATAPAIITDVSDASALYVLMPMPSLTSKEIIMDLSKLSIGKNPSETINVVIEIPQGGSPIKYEVDKDSGALLVDRFMTTAMFYPANYGFVPHTLSGDGDPCDVLVIAPLPIAHGAVVAARPIGVLLMKDESGQDEKILAVPTDKLSPFTAHIKSSADVPQILLDQIEHFFKHYKDLEKGKWVEIIRWGDAEEAKSLIMQGVERAQKKAA